MLWIGACGRPCRWPRASGRGPSHWLSRPRPTPPTVSCGTSCSTVGRTPTTTCSVSWSTPRRRGARSTTRTRGRPRTRPWATSCPSTRCAPRSARPATTRSAATGWASGCPGRIGGSRGARGKRVRRRGRSRPMGPVSSSRSTGRRRVTRRPSSAARWRRPRTCSLSGRGSTHPRTRSGGSRGTRSRRPWRTRSPGGTSPNSPRTRGGGGRRPKSGPRRTGPESSSSTRRSGPAWPPRRIGRTPRSSRAA